MKTEEIEFHKFFTKLYGKDKPELNELVIATVIDIKSHGIYVFLDEYGLQAYCPINELSTKWVKKPSDLVRLNQKVVAQVYKISHGGHIINVSLKRVLPGERKKKLADWKRFVRSLMIFKLIAEKMGKSFDEIVEKVAKPLAEEFENPYYGMEEVVKEGKELLEEIGIPKEYIDPVYEVIKANVRPSEVELKKYLIIKSLAPDGIQRIKRGLEKGINLAPERIVVEYISAPRYLIKIRGYEWKEVAKLFNKFVKAVESEVVDKKWKSEVYVEGEEGRVRSKRKGR